MIKAVVIDDESYIRQDVIERIAKDFSDKINVVGEGSSLKNGLKLIEQEEPDVVFLDIDLTDGTGFDLLKSSSYRGFEVIFITGLDMHAIQAIKVGALDYILKPVDQQEFKQAVLKAINLLDQPRMSNTDTDVSYNYYKRNDDQRIVLRTAESIYTVLLDDIVYCQSDGNYTTFIIDNTENIIISKPLKKMIDILPENLFIRCHQSYVVNKKFVSKYDKQGFFVLQNSSNIPVSTRRKDYAIKLVFG